MRTLPGAPGSDQRGSSGTGARGLEDVPASGPESSQDLSLHGDSPDPGESKAQDPRDPQTLSEQLQGRGRPRRGRIPLEAESALQAQSRRRLPEGLRRLRPRSAEPRTFPGPRPARPHRGLRRRPPRRPARPPARAGAPRAAGGGPPRSRLLSRHRTDQTSGTGGAGARVGSASQPHRPQGGPPPRAPPGSAAALSPGSLPTALPYIHVPGSQGDHLPARPHARPPGSLFSLRQAPQPPTSGWKERPLRNLSTRPPRPARNRAPLKNATSKIKHFCLPLPRRLSPASSYLPSPRPAGPASPRSGKPARCVHLAGQGASTPRQILDLDLDLLALKYPVCPPSWCKGSLLARGFSVKFST